MHNAQMKKIIYQLLAVTIIIWLVWLPLSTSGNLRMDSDRMLFHPEEALSQYVQEGRFGLVLLLNLFGLTSWNPVLSGLLFLAFFTLSIWLLCFFIFHFTKGNQKFPYALFALILGTCPTWAFHIYFVLQIAAIGFGLFLTVLLAGMDAHFHLHQKKLSWPLILYELCSLLLLSFSLSIYQGLIVYYLAAAAIFFFCHILRDHSLQLRHVLWWGIRVLLSLGFYLCTSYLIAGGTSSYLSQQIQWGQLPVLQCLMNIAIQFGKSVVFLHSACVSLYPLAIALFIVLLIHQWKEHPGQTKRNLLLLLAGMAIVLLPMAMSVLQGSRPVPRTQFGLQVAAAFLPAIFLALSPGKNIFVRALCVLVVCLQIVLNIRLIHTDNVRNQADLQTANMITTHLKDTSFSEKPLIFFGSLPFHDDSVFLEKTDVYGRSFFEWIYDENNPSSATTSAVRLLRACDDTNYQACKDASLIKQAVDLASSLPAFPQEGYILESEQYILIKLSE